MRPLISFSRQDFIYTVSIVFLLPKLVEKNKKKRFFLTINERIVESNPKKFNLDAAELSKRKAFITCTRQTVKVCVCVCVCAPAPLGAM